MNFLLLPLYSVEADKTTPHCINLRSPVCVCGCAWVRAFFGAKIVQFGIFYIYALYCIDLRILIKYF